MINRRLTHIFHAFSNRDPPLKRTLKKRLPKPDTLKRPGLPKFLESLLDNPHLLHLTRHSVSTGVAIGFFVACLPILGQTPVAACLAYMLRANLVVSLLCVWTSNPITTPFILYSGYSVGTLLVGDPAFSDAGGHRSIQWWLDNVPLIWKQLWIGCLILASSSSFIGYQGVRGVWAYQVRRAWNKRRQRRNRHS